MSDPADQAAQEAAARAEQAAREKTAREEAARAEQLAREKAAREESARQEAERANAGGPEAAASEQAPDKATTDKATMDRTANKAADNAPDKAASRGRVSWWAVVLLLVLFIAEALMLLYSAVALWPIVENRGIVGVFDGALGPPPLLERQFLGQEVELDIDRSYFVVVVLCGALGSMVYVLRSFSQYVGNQLLMWSWVPKYVVVPVLGAVLAAIVYVALRAGLLTGPLSTEGNPFGFAAVALLAGMFTTQTIAKMKNVFEVVMTPEEKGADPLESAVLQVTGLVPTTGKVGDKVTLQGKGLDGVTKVQFHDRAVAAFSTEGDKLVVLVPEAATTGVVTVWQDQRFSVSPQPFTVT